MGEGFTPTRMAHPDTYLNKVVVASQQGTLQLWNFSKGTRLYDFKVADCAIKCLAPSPALDVVGIGLADGCALSLGILVNALCAQSMVSSFSILTLPALCPQVHRAQLRQLYKGSWAPLPIFCCGCVMLV